MKVQQVSPGIINKIKSLIARVGYLKSDIGIVEDTDTATHTISSGQYVIWKNELYKASAAIPSGDPLSSTNLTAVSDGIANELNSNITAVDNKVQFIEGTPISSIGVYSPSGGRIALTFTYPAGTTADRIVQIIFAPTYIRVDSFVSGTSQQKTINLS